MKHKLIPKRIGALLLCLTLLAGLLPTAAWAADADKAIMLGTEHLQGGQEDNIYFGNWTAPDTNTTSGPIKWRVLSMNGNSGTYSDGTETVDAKNAMFLLSDVLLGGTYRGVYFDKSGSDSNVWQNSTAQEWCETFYSGNLTTHDDACGVSRGWRRSGRTGRDRLRSG